MKRIKYICYYPSQDTKKPRKCVEAATTKIDYIVSVLNRKGIAVDIISPAIVSKKGFCFSIGESTTFGINTLKFFPSFGCLGFAPLRGLSRLLTYYCFRRYLKNKIIDNEDVIVYHTLDYCSFLLNLRKTHNFRLIGEVEEIYQDVYTQTPKLSEDEYRFFGICDCYIFPNTLLNEKINNNDKPSLVIHGIYKLQAKIAEKFDDGKIHVLYSGTFDPIKGGALAAIEAGLYLSENYHVHVTGFGNEKHYNTILKKAEEIKRKSQALITLHGFISRQDLIVLMQQCHIGLCTQDPTKKLNLTSFPSKILNYMANGLIVLSGRNRAIEESAIGDIIKYYDVQTPDCIARSIMDIHDYNSELGNERLRLLDKKFGKELANFLMSDIV